MDYEGVIIEESLRDPSVLGRVTILSTRVETVTEWHQTPWLTQWTFLTIRVPEQETTDFEKALYCTEAPVTIALGMTGGRFDHTLAALDAVTKHGKDRPIILVDEADLAMALTGPFSFEVEPHERVSVHPLLPIRFKRSKGLKYPLDNLRLAPGERTGTSNEAVDGPFRIEPESRARPWLLVLDRKYLFGVAAAAAAMAG